ncbi:hypothetical protein BHE74_00052033, partial [Ensete ventricosum]
VRKRRRKRSRGKGGDSCERSDGKCGGASNGRYGTAEIVPEDQHRAAAVVARVLPAGRIRVLAEGDKVVGRGAGEGGGGVVERVAVSPRAGVLEEPEVGRRRAGGGVAVAAAAAVLREPEGLPRALTRHALTGPGARPCHHLQVRWAHPIEIHHAPRGTAIPAGAAPRRHQHRQVVAVHQAHVVIVNSTPATAQGELGQRGWRSRPDAGSLHLTGPAVAGPAAEPTDGVGGAEVATPEAARPRGRRVEALRLSRLHGESHRGERRIAGTREHPGPHRVVAVVRQRKCSSQAL